MHHIFFKKYSPEKIYEYKNNVRNIDLLHQLSLVAPNHPIMSPVMSHELPVHEINLTTLCTDYWFSLNGQYMKWTSDIGA